MAKKGARQTGGTKGRKREHDQRMANQLPPAPVTWNHRPDLWPYHNNLRKRPRQGA